MNDDRTENAPCSINQIAHHHAKNKRQSDADNSRWETALKMQKAKPDGL